jgi:hypothetical protein
MSISRYLLPPASAGAVFAASAISSGVGMAVGALWAGGGWNSWGWGDGWGGNNAVITSIAWMSPTAITGSIIPRQAPTASWLLLRMLTGQGSHVPGGGRSYPDHNEQMTKDPAMIAWPSNYSSFGITTFVVNKTGIIYQKYLGRETAAIASALTAYDPDETWVPVSCPPLACGCRLWAPNIGRSSRTLTRYPSPHRKRSAYEANYGVRDTGMCGVDGLRT